jgi:hypothetical protein
MTTMILSHSHMTPIYLHMTTMVLSHSHMTPIYLHMTTMILSHSHMTLQFTFIWQLWYCHIHIWLQFTFIWQLWYCRIHIWLFNLPSNDNYDIVTFTYDSPIYLHITTMILSYSHMTLQFTIIWQLWYCHIHIWLFNLPSYDNYDIVIFTYDSPIYLHMTTMILSHSHMTSIYLPMTTMILSHSHMTLQFTFI